MKTVIVIILISFIAYICYLGSKIDDDEFFNQHG